MSYVHCQLPLPSVQEHDVRIGHPFQKQKVKGGGQEHPPCTCGSSEGETVRLAEEVPGFAVAGVGVSAGVAFGAKGHAGAHRDLPHWNDVPGFFRNDIDHYEIDIGFFVGDHDTVSAATNAGLIQAAPHAAASLYLYAPKAASALDDEIIGKVVPTGLGYHEAETHGFVDEGGFAKFAALVVHDSACLGTLVGRAPLARWHASARTALGCAHGLKWGSPAKEKAQAEKLAPNLIPISRIPSLKGNYDMFSRFIFPAES
jgi:hypothetical protein